MSKIFPLQLYALVDCVPAHSALLTIDSVNGTIVPLISMRLIIDTSILVAVLVSEPERDRIVSLTKDADLLAPQSIHWEIGNALSAMIKKRRIGPNQALLVIQAYETIPIRFVDTDLHEAMAIAGKYGLFAYDAYLIACALHQRCSMMSLDAALIQAAIKAGVTIVEVPKV